MSGEQVHIQDHYIVTCLRETLALTSGVEDQIEVKISLDGCALPQ